MGAGLPRRVGLGSSVISLCADLRHNTASDPSYAEICDMSLVLAKEDKAPARRL